MYPPHFLFMSVFLAPIFTKPPPPPNLEILFHVVPLCNYCFPSSIAFACLFLYFREPLLSAGHGVLPSVQDDMSGWRDTSFVHHLIHTAHINIQKNIWAILSQTCQKSYNISSEFNCFVNMVNIKKIIIVMSGSNLNIYLATL